jgi:AraC-like DNA-binding protein
VLNSRKSIVEIALAVGYQSQSHFTAFFRKATAVLQNSTAIKGAKNIVSAKQPEVRISKGLGCENARWVRSLHILGMAFQTVNGEQFVLP